MEQQGDGGGVREAWNKWQNTLSYHCLYSPKDVACRIRGKTRLTYLVLESLSQEVEPMVRIHVEGEKDKELLSGAS